MQQVARQVVANLEMLAFEIVLQVGKQSGLCVSNQVVIRTFQVHLAGSKRSPAKKVVTPARCAAL